MHVRSILLGRYGGYEDRRVEFGPGLTVVVGPNEAGKSTLLDALTDVLWGFPRPVRHAYLVAASRLDLTATVTLSSGATAGDDVAPAMTIRRSPKAVAGPAPEWGSGGQDARRAWRQGFGLSHAELRSGGQALCEGGGDLAELVFAVRSGNDVRSILSALADEADRLYKPHKGARSVEVRAAMGRADQVDEQVRDQMAAASDVGAAEDRVRRVAARRTTAAADHAAAVDAARSAREAAAAFPHAVELARLHAERVALVAEGPVPDQRQLDGLATVTAALDQAERDIAGLGDALAERRSQRDALDIDEAILADAATITRLGQERAARTQDRDRLALLDDRTEAHRRTASAALDDLTGPDARPILERLRDVHVPTDRAATLDELGAELAKAEATDDRLRTTHLAALRRVGEVARSIDRIDLDAAQRVVELRRTIAANDSPVALHQAAVTARGAAEHGLRRALNTVRDLAGPAEPVVDPLRTAEWPAIGPGHAAAPGETATGTNGQVHVGLADPVEAEPDSPVVETVAQAPPAARMTELRDRLRGAATATDTAVRDHGRAGERRYQAQRAVNDARTADALPSAELLHRVRGQRDHHLDAVLTALRNGDTHTATSAVVGLVRASLNADHIADDLITGAERVAELSRREADLRTAERELGDAARATENARREHRFAHAQWSALWSAGGAPVPHPDVADTVRQALLDADRARTGLHDARGRIVELATDVARLRDQLRAALAAHGRTRPDADLPGLLAAAAEIETLAGTSREDRARLAELRDQAAAAGDAADAARHDHDEAAGRWRFGLAAVGAPTDLSPAQWSARRAAIATVHRAHTSADESQSEAAAIRATLAAFDALLVARR